LCKKIRYTAGTGDMPNMDNNNSQQPQQNGNNNKFPKGQFIVMLIAALVTLGVAGMMKSYMGSRSQKEVTYDQFIEEVEDGQVESILRRSSRIEIRYKESSEKFALALYLRIYISDFRFLNFVQDFRFPGKGRRWKTKE
jgi:ATP-dependent Zn protease